jgi:3-methyl-2-oxobutanoate hydroxymethyltransferase
LLEALPPTVGKIITESLSIPVYGIGSGPHTDGQLLIVSDMLGIFEDFKPKFVKRYADVAGEMERAFTEYISEVKSGEFPSKECCYRMSEEENTLLLEAWISE